MNRAKIETINDKKIKFFIFFLATKKKNFRSPTSKIFKIEFIRSIILVNIYFFYQKISIIRVINVKNE